MGRSVTAFDASAFLDSGALNVPSATVDTVADELLAPDVLQGKRIFYDASDTRMSAEGYMSCATCHLDGSHDGRTWDFTSRGEGFRNTTDLRGRSGTGHGNVHWTANFDEIQDFEGDIRGFFGGSGFLADTDFTATIDPLGPMKGGLDDDLDALAAYVESLTAGSLPRSPERNPDGTRGAAAENGAAIFAAEGCAGCHVPATDYTDRTMHDVGTMRASSGERLGGPLTGIETPTLLGAHASAPYFHDGSAATLEDVFTRTGGRLAQAEDATLGGGGFADDVPWFPMKEWHQGAYVEISGGQTITFDDVETSLAGDGYIEIRYAVQYGTANLSVAVNGGSATIVPLAMTPNIPSYVPTEWRTVRVPITFASGTNTVVLSRTSGGVLAIDDVLFSTPDDAELASAHVRDLAPEDLADLVSYVASLDGQDAAVPAGECGGSEQPACGSALVLTKAGLTLGPPSRPDKGQLKLAAVLEEALPAGDLLADLGAGLSVRVRDADASFDVTLSIPGCILRGDGISIACGNMQDGARALLRPADGVWRLTLKARDLPAAVTGAGNAEANPVQGPARAVLVRGGVAHAGALSDCRERFPRKLTCRN